MRVLFFTERLAPPFDEGIKNVAVNLLRRLAPAHDLLALTMEGADIPELGVRNLSAKSRLSSATNRLLLDAGLRREIRSFRPDRICYLPTASMTLFAFLRSRVLQSHGRRRASEHDNVAATSPGECSASVGVAACPRTGHRAIEAKRRTAAIPG